MLVECYDARADEWYAVEALDHATYADVMFWVGKFIREGQRVRVTFEGAKP